jgi:hypothetical protein
MPNQDDLRRARHRRQLCLRWSIGEPEYNDRRREEAMHDSYRSS